MNKKLFRLLTFFLLFKWLRRYFVVGIILLILMIWLGVKLTSYIFHKINPPPGPQVHVETMAVKTHPGLQRWQAIGTVKSERDIVLGSEVTGTIQNLAVASGQKVNENDLLLTIRHDDHLAQLQKDEAILTQKKLFLERQQRLMTTNATSKEALNEAQSAFQQAQAAVLADHALLSKYIIKAPFAGQLGIWQVHPGQLVQSGTIFITLTDSSPAYIDFSLPASALGKVKVGDNIQFSTSTLGDRIWQGKIIAIDPQLDHLTRNLSLRAQVENEDGSLVPRLYGKVMVIKPSSAELSIPQEAIIYDPQGSSVYVVKNNIAERRTVKLGTHDGENIIIKNGLDNGDNVVIAGMMKVFPGMKVIVNEAKG